MKTFDTHNAYIHIIYVYIFIQIKLLYIIKLVEFCISDVLD